MGDTDHRALGVELFNETWSYIDNADRTDAEDLEMIGAALASWHHWRQVGEPRNFSISDWQVSRAFALIGNARMAASFGESNLELCTGHDLDAFVTGFAHESLARAAAVAGDPEARDRHLAAGREMAARIKDEDDRAVLVADLDEIAAA